MTNKSLFLAQKCMLFRNAYLGRWGPTGDNGDHGRPRPRPRNLADAQTTPLPTPPGPLKLRLFGEQTCSTSGNPINFVATYTCKIYKNPSSGPRNLAASKLLMMDSDFKRQKLGDCLKNSLKTICKNM